MKNLRDYIRDEFELANRARNADDLATAYRHLERAHVLAQGITSEHARVHWRMLEIGWRKRDWREMFGQLIRIVGAATKTPFGIYPPGNTGGSNVWFFKRMPVADDLQQILNQEKMK